MGQQGMKTLYFVSQLPVYRHGSKRRFVGIDIIHPNTAKKEVMQKSYDHNAIECPPFDHLVRLGGNLTGIIVPCMRNDQGVNIRIRFRGSSGKKVFDLVFQDMRLVRIELPAYKRLTNLPLFLHRQPFSGRFFIPARR